MFEVGVPLKRSLIHDMYGGNRQGGISPSATYPYIFIFSGKSGEAHGYEDGWGDDGYFYYTGEGRKGDMEFVRGNKQLLKHEENGKKVFLFYATKKSMVEFVDDLTLVDYHYFKTPDSDNKIRKGIKFKFKSKKDSYRTAASIKTNALNYNKPTKTERSGLIVSRVGQGWYRKRLLEKWNFSCAITKVTKTEILIASHIIPWKESTDEQRLDPNNGILLTPNLDALFDKHLISFDDSGLILINKSVQPYNSELGIHDKMRIKIDKGMKPYLKKHREKFEKNN